MLPAGLARAGLLTIRLRAEERRLLESVLQDGETVSSYARAALMAAVKRRAGREG